MRRYPLALTLALSLGLSACGDSTTSFNATDASAEPPDAMDAALTPDVSAVDVPRAPDAARPDVPAVQDTGVDVRDVPVFMPDVPPRAGGTYDYVINDLQIDPGTSATVAHSGFNLDGFFSSQTASERTAADCDHGDFLSSLDPDQNMGACMMGAAGCRGGVDNQLPALAETAMLVFDLRAQLRSQVDGGQLTFLVRVSNVDGELSATLDDPEVVIRVFVGRSMLPASNCAGIYAPGARYAIDQASLFVPTDLDSARFAAVGSIRAGRLVLGAPMAGSDLTLSLPLFSLGGSEAALDLHGAQLRMDMTADRAARGNLGGFVIAQDAIDSITAIPAAEAYRAIITSLVRGLVDIQRDGTCGLGGGVGMGLGFTAVRATIDDRAVDGPRPGNCGSY